MENLIKNSFEKPFVETKTLTPQELRCLIVDEDEHEIKDSRFLSKEEGGVFHYFRPEDLKTENYFPIVKEGEIITGIAALQKAHSQKNYFG